MVEIDTNVLDFTNRNNFGIIVCTSGTRPTAVDGKFIYETDTDKTYVYNGAAWVKIGGWVGIATSDLNMGSYDVYGTAGYKIYFNGDGGGTYLKDDASGNMELHVATGKKVKIIVG